MTRHSLITLLRPKIQSTTLLRQKIGLVTHYAITHCTFLITLLRKKNRANYALRHKNRAHYAITPTYDPPL